MELEIDVGPEGAAPTWFFFFLDFRVGWFMMPVRGVGPAIFVLLAAFVWVRSTGL
jgi:hypothetical protein